MGIPTVYKKPVPIIASYSFTDIAEGTGVVKYYGYVTQTGSADPGATDDEHLTTDSSVYSPKIEITPVSLVGNTALTKIYDKDYDLSPFSLPVTIKGTGLYLGGMYMEATHANPRAYIIVRLKKNDVQIVAGTSKQLATTTNTSKIAGIPLTIPRTHFNKGDVMRLTVEIWADTSPGPQSMDAFVIGHDPQNRDGTKIKPSTAEIISMMLLYVPFEIEL